jgi:radical SAM protein with 4Fe4S-binding SPASM domain
VRRALRNALRLGEARKRQRAKHPQIRIVLLRRNLHQLRELVRLAREHGADSLVLEHLWHDGGAARRFVEAESLLNEDAEKLDGPFAEARSLADELGVELSLPRARRADPPAAGLRCDRPWRGIYVGASGEALPCAMLKTPQRLNLGNMRRSGVVRVWNSEAYREFRERLASSIPPDICRRCAVYDGMV